MAYRIIETNKKKFDGFFDYQENNQIEGVVKCVLVTAVVEGKEHGYIGIEVCKPCLAKIDDTPIEVKKGMVIAVSMTADTRVLIGTEGKKVRCTFLGFRTTKKGRYHEWLIEIDDET